MRTEVLHSVLCRNTAVEKQVEKMYQIRTSQYERHPFNKRCACEIIYGERTLVLLSNSDILIYGYAR